MSGGFSAEANPAEASLAEAEASAPGNPFMTAAYTRSRQLAGESTWLLSVMRDGARTEWCPAFARSGRLSSTLEIPSAFSFSAPFVEGLLDLCRTERVSALQLNTYASPPGLIPAFPNETARVARCEYVINLTVPDVLAAMSKSHRVRVRQGEKAGLTMRRSRDADACNAHLRMMVASMARRLGRGEQVPMPTDDAWARVLLDSGAGELFQAVLEDEVVSSMLVLRSRLAGYDQSSGSSPEGLKVSAVPFLIYRTSAALRDEGCTAFNLGGARAAESGLREFKSHFGAVTVDLELVECRPPTGFVHETVMRASGAIRSRASAAIAKLRGSPDAQSSE